jgi:metallo-beta-lactamase family protein
MNLTFLGAADTVTGSRFLVHWGDRRVLVDCGLFQGLKHLRLRNRAPHPVAPADIDAVILTHAHLDHTGYLPVLVRDGFRGPIYCTAPTAQLCGLLLPDSGHLQEEEAARANRYGYSRHDPALPLYTAEDGRRAVERLEPVAFDVDLPVAGSAMFRMRHAGHILGAASVALTAEDRTIVFSGDIGRPSDPVLRPAQAFEHADYLLIESTYGDRAHAARPARDVLADIVRATAARDGVVVIPSFAVGRAQTLLFHLAELHAAGEIPTLPVYLDSPMAADATEYFLDNPHEHRLTREQCARMRAIVTITNSVGESKAIDRQRGPMVVISASGMATGGRVLFHIERFAPDPRNTILFAGYQAAGTRGAAMAAGAATVKMHGRQVPIRAHVEVLHGLSGHADADELMDWLDALRTPPRATFVVHGEPVAADTLRVRIQDELGWNVRVPEHGEQVDLS